MKKDKGSSQSKKQSSDSASNPPKILTQAIQDAQLATTPDLSLNSLK